MRQVVRQHIAAGRSAGAGRMLAIALGLGVAAVPAGATWTLVHLLLGASLVGFHPYYSDEIHYWHEALTFSRVGFAGGYYTVNELSAPLPLFHFGPHGPAFPVLQGSAGWAIGWAPSAGVLLNQALVTAALALFLSRARLGLPWLLLLGSFLALFWPLLLLLPTNMQEPTHYAIAITLAAFFWPLLTGEQPRAPLRWLVLAGAIAIAGLIRPTWLLLLVPLALLLTWGRGRQRIVVGLSAAALGVGTGVWVFTLAAAPSPSALSTSALRLAPTAPLVALELVRDRMAANLLRLVPAMSPTDSIWLMLAERLQLGIVLVLAALLLALVIVRRRSARLLATTRSVAERQAMFHLSNIGVPALAQLAFYAVGDWQDYRVLGPHLLLSAFVLLAMPPGRAVLAAMVAVNLAVAMPFVNTYRVVRAPNFVADSPTLPPFRQVVEQVLVYEGGVSGWCNTLLTTGYVPEFVAVPAGIGMSVTSQTSYLPTPVRSRYLLLRGESYAVLADRLDVDWLASTPVGDIYRNRTARC
jgi:hypothetical protein